MGRPPEEEVRKLLVIAQIAADKGNLDGWLNLGFTADAGRFVAVCQSWLAQREALLAITRAEWGASDAETPFQFEQRVHRIAASALAAGGETETPPEKEL